MSFKQIVNGLVKELCEIKKDENSEMLKKEILNPIIKKLLFRVKSYFFKAMIIFMVVFIMLITIIILNLNIIYYK